MIGHLGINVPDLGAAKRYYDDLMPLVEFEPFLSSADQFAYRPSGGRPGRYVFFYPATDGDAYSRERKPSATTTASERPIVHCGAFSSPA